jgi:hypothetical protein
MVKALVMMIMIIVFGYWIDYNDDLYIHTLIIYVLH